MILVDTGILLSAIDGGDRDNRIALATLGSHVGQLLVPSTVVAETAWQVERYHQSWLVADFSVDCVLGALRRRKPDASHNMDGRQLALPDEFVHGRTPDGEPLCCDRGRETRRRCMSSFEG